MNIQHSTFNIQCPRRRSLAWHCVGCSVLEVECWMLLFLFCSSISSFAQPAGKLPPLAPAYGELPPTFWEQHGNAMLLAGILLIFLAAAGIWKMLQPRLAVVLPPEVLAREAITKLLGQPEDGKLLSEVSQILRRYIVAVFELSPVEMTTTEFCAALGANEKIDDGLAQSIAAFLRECDGRKFSPTTSSAAFNAVNRALELVSLAEMGRARSNIQREVGENG